MMEGGGCLPGSGTMRGGAPCPLPGRIRCSLYAPAPHPARCSAACQGWRSTERATCGIRGQAPVSTMFLLWLTGTCLYTADPGRTRGPSGHGPSSV